MPATLTQRTLGGCTVSGLLSQPSGFTVFLPLSTALVVVDVATVRAFYGGGQWVDFKIADITGATTVAEVVTSVATKIAGATV